MTTSRLVFSKIVLAVALAFGCAGASAHPHVWVSVETTVLYADGTITGFQHAWTFDEAYTAMAIEGLDANGDGKYERKELAELAKVNMDGLKGFNYFTVAKLGNGDLKFAPPTDYWLEYKEGGILTLHFTLPLEHAVLAEAPAFTFSVYDPSFFIAFDFAKANPVKLSAHAPAGCKAVIGAPTKSVDDAQKLGEAFYNELGGGDFGTGMANNVSINCAKS